MHSFQYHRPASLAEAGNIIKGAADGAYLAGGMTLLPTLKQNLSAASDLVDLSALGDLRGIKVKGGGVTIGAMTTHAEVAANAELRSAIPALAALAGGIGDPHVRNRGTIGGSVANADPAADYPAAVLALNATVHTDSRTIAADDFFTGMFETALKPGELITAISFPATEAAAYAKFPNPASRYAIVGVMVAKSGGEVRVAVTGAAGSVFRALLMEQALTSNFHAEALDEVTVPADKVQSLNSDIHAGIEYRAHLMKVMAKRAVKAMV